MKHLLILLLSTMLFSCSKSDGDDDGPQQPTQKTTVNFHNELPRSFGNVLIGNYTTSGTTLVKNVGTLSEGGSTGELPINDPNIKKLFFYYEENGKVYMDEHGFLISQGTSNNLHINGNTSFIQIEKNSVFYPK